MESTVPYLYINKNFILIIQSFHEQDNQNYLCYKLFLIKTYKPLTEIKEEMSEWNLEYIIL